MNTATAEKPVSPLGSFLAKMTPAPAKVEEKSDEVKPEAKAPEKAVEVNDATAKSDTGTQAGSDAKTPATAGTEAATHWQRVRAKEKAEKDTKLQERANALAEKNDLKEVARAIAEAERRAEDARSWGNEERKARLDADRKVADLQAHLTRIESKVDGTYVEADVPSTEQVVADADIRGRIKASHKAAVRQYGEQFVMETVWNAESPYQELQARDHRIKARVMEAEDPVGEAIAVVKEHQDGERYGRTPEEIRKKIEAELKPQLEKQLLDGLKTKPGPATNTLGNVRGGTERTEQKSDAPTRLDFAKVFPHGRSRT